MQQIFVHGLGQTPSSWDKTIENLAMNSNCNCPDLSEMLRNQETNYTNLYTAFSKYCDGFPEPLAICGLSLGGVLALHYGIEHPQKVKSLALIAAQYKMPKKLLAFQNVIFRFMPNSMFQQMGLGKEQFIQLSKSMMELDYSGELNQILCPVLVICGEEDSTNMKASKELAGRLARAEFCMIEKAGHEVNVDAPERLARVLDGFMYEKGSDRADGIIE